MNLPPVNLGEADRSPPLAEFPRDKCLHQLFEAHVARTPDAVAVVCDNAALTYRQLDQQANQLAHYLIHRHHLRPGDRVGLRLGRSLEFVVAVIGILKAGAAYVPLDPHAPPARLHFLIQAAGLHTVIGDSPPDFLPAEDSPCQFLPWSSLHPALKDFSGAPPDVPVCAADLAYVMFTSGSTGTPKGVEVPHRAVVRLVCGPDYLPFDAHQVFLLLAPPEFDASTLELWGPLLHGAKLAVYPHPQLELDRLREVLSRHQVTCLWLTASLFNTIIDQQPDLLQSLRHLLTGGEALSVRYVRRALELLPGVQLLNGYGPTEGTTFTTTYSIPQSLPADLSSIPIGRPLANTQVYLLDEALQPVPLGVAGELHIGGDGLARGYLNRPDLTAAKFIPNPFSSDPGARLYKTGDLGRYLPDGNIEFIGRLDHQVKIRGFRIELGEIETVLGSHPDLTGVVVTAREDVPGEKCLVAYVVSRPQPGPTVTELREFLKSRLPDYMVPGVFVSLAHLPLNANGKVDRNALPIPSANRLGLGNAFVEPQSSTEKLLAEIWCEVLNTDKVGIHDDFFELGGHSLSVLKVVSRLRRSLAVDLSLRTLFESPTIAGLAGKLLGDAARLHEKVTPLVPLPRSGPLLLSFAQERLWFLDRCEEKSSAYHIAQVLHLRGSLNHEALERAIREIVVRHESLRTCFVEVAGEASQRVSPTVLADLPLQDLGALQPAVREKTITGLIRETIDEPFDLREAPLWRMRVLKLGDDEHILVWVCHHIVADGWSMGVFNRELTALYESFCRMQSSSLKPLPVQYLDFALWQRQCLHGENRERALKYWVAKLAGAPPLSALPTDYPRSVQLKNRGESRTLTVSADLAQSLSHLSHRHGVTLFMTLLSAFKVLLARLSGAEDIVVGTPISGRDQLVTEDMIGFFVNTVVLRNDLSGNPTFGELLKRVRETTLAAFVHQDLPFEILVDNLHLRRDLSHTPVFQVFFNMLNFEDAPPPLADLEVVALPLPEVDAKFDLTLYVVGRGDQLVFRAVYKRELFRSETIERMLGQYNLLLEQVALDAAIPIQGYTLVRPQDVSVLPDPRVALACPNEWTIHDGFSAQARRVPDRTAVADVADCWTYAELESTSNRLANYLRRQGLQRGEVVGIYACPSASLVWCLLGILKAGGVFLILDSAYPESRLRKALQKAKTVALLSLQAAGELPALIQEFATSDAVRCWLKIPPSKAQQGEGFLSDCPPDDAGVSVTSDDAAYAVFTSGSTGTPLGILGIHLPVSHFLRWHIRTFGLKEDDRFSLFSGLSHDPLLRDVFTPLWLGASLHIPPREVRESPGCLVAWINRKKISVSHLTPAFTELLGEREPSDLHGLDSLRLILLGGDRLTPAVVYRLRRWTPDCVLVNFYGATETPQAVGFHVIKSGDEADLSPQSCVTLGRGIEGVQLLLLNQSGQLAGVGELSEICVRTPYLSKKYLDEENLTRDRFQINPSTKTAADVIFRTGDMGCYLPDGRVAYAGRKDGQVKLRGFRVELAEVESCLREFEGVRECVVAASEDRHGENQLVAYIVPVATDFATRLPGLRDFLKQKVPAYMIPSAFAILERMPLTPNGKIDRKALRDVPLVDPVVAKGPAVPSTPLEQQLAQIWQRILSLPTVGVRDNFFDLGGHSLMAVRLVSEINRTLHFNMRVLNLFQHPTIESLAKILEFQTTDHQKQGLVQLQHGNFGPEIFFIVDEGSMDLFQLARSMDESRAVYASLVPLSDAMLHASAHRHSARFPTMEELAAGHAELIRSHQKNRPCLLGGHCFGGMLAFEVAQQLRRMGTPVEAVFLMDTWLKRPSRTWWLKTWLQTHVRNLVKDGPAYLWRKSRHRFNLEWRQLVSTIMPATFNNPPEPQFTRPIVRRLYRHASKMYGPQVLASRGILLLSKDDWAANAFRKLHPEMGATPFFRDGLLVVDVPGDHVTMLKDTNIQVLAEVCNRHLRAK